MTLKERCLELPYTERLNLCAAIQDSILQERRDGRNPYQNRGQILMGMMNEIQGEPVPAKSRCPRWVWSRRMVAYQLILEGYSISDIGRMLEKDHATVIQMRHRMQDAFHYSYAYQDILELWKQFQNKIDHDIHNRTDQNPISLGGQLQDCDSCTMGQESGDIRTHGDS